LEVVAMGRNPDRPGPTTPAGKARALANLHEPGEAALTHQAWRNLASGLFPVCDKCAARDRCTEYREGGTCTPAARAQAAQLKAIMALPQVTEMDRWAAEEYARIATALRIVDLHLAHAGLFVGDGAGSYLEEQPVMRLRMKLSNALRQWAGELGLTPAARKRLEQEHQADSAVAVIAELRARYTDAPVALEGEVDDGQGEGDAAAGEVS
jgi:hypothetical protein